MKKIIEKPYAGKLHVRFDEGAGKAFAPFRSTLPFYYGTRMIADFGGCPRIHIVALLIFFQSKKRITLQA